MTSQSSVERWKVCCAKAPRTEIVYFSQLIVAAIVILVGLFNITLTENDTCLWSSIVSGTLGYLLPSPSLKRKHEQILSHDSVEFVDGMLSEQHGEQICDETSAHN